VDSGALRGESRGAHQTYADELDRARARLVAVASAGSRP